MIQKEVIVIQRTKTVLVAISYKQQIYHALTLDAKRKLLQGKKVLISNKPEQLDPFKDQLFGVEFRGMYVTGEWMIAKIKPVQLEQFIQKNVKDNIRIKVQTEYGALKWFSNKQEFINSL